MATGSNPDQSRKGFGGAEPGAGERANSGRDHMTARLCAFGQATSNAGSKPVLLMRATLYFSALLATFHVPVFWSNLWQCVHSPWWAVRNRFPVPPTRWITCMSCANGGAIVEPGL